jgi:hypothetical protein|tara:strand:- start:1520 stop:2884 length:1365 start_codon:yes stop_codon:yes gene_type:complete
MALNPYFTQGTRGEQNLVQDLINEQLRTYGVDVHYIPRKYITSNTIIKEVIQSKFDDAYPIEAYVKSDSYEGAGILMSKFGVQQQDDVTLIISRERWETYIQPLIQNEQNIKLASRPKGGDLIYFPLDDRLYEIKFVEYANPFYQLQDLYTYELRCEVFRYEDEVIDTGIEDIDDSMEDAGYAETLTLLGIGQTATATATFTNGGIGFISLTSQGQGYTSTPQVAISSSPGIQATAVAITTSATGFSTASSVKAILLTNPGAGYTIPPSVVLVGGGGAGAATTVGIATTGGVGIVTLTSGGTGYSTTPTVTFSSPGTGITAIGEAVVSSAGTVTAIRISNAGYGYTVSPTITIGNPSLIGNGDYIYNEIVTGGTTGTQARVKKWISSTGELRVSIANGTFSSGETITGQDSGAQRTLSIVNTDDLIDAYADNDNIQAAADGILDFTQRNPFGEV